MNKDIVVYLPDMNGEGIDESGRTHTINTDQLTIIDQTIDGLIVRDTSGVEWIAAGYNREETND